MIADADRAGPTQEPELLWAPSPAFAASTEMARYMRWLEETRGLSFGGYAELHAWSVAHVEDFWASLFDYFEVESATPYSAVLTSHDMPGAHWFPGAQVNFARHVLRNVELGRDRPAIFHQSEGGPIGEIDWGELEDRVARIAAFLRSRGVGKGDRVAAYVTNVPEAAILFLAAAAIGAVWTSVSPEFGPQAVEARFRQVEPRVLLVVDGYRFGGKVHDRTDAVRSIAAALPTLETVIHLPSAEWAGTEPLVADAVSWDQALAATAADLTYAATEFEHPLFICFSSGTTGVPKAIVHGHGGVTLEMFKLHALHDNLDADSRAFFYSTTAWIVWMCSVVSGLITGGAVVLYDGNPIAPDPTCLWRLAAETRVTSFGASPVFLGAMMNAGMVPREQFDLNSIRSVQMTGSPASPEVCAWAARAVGDDVSVGNLSGGTDLCSAIVGVCPILPVWSNEFQCAQLGVDAVALSDAGEPMVGTVGELVIRQPMPTMPLHFLHDPDGAKLRESYYDTFPNMWRHGDFFEVTARGTSLIHGRSDATLNRHGIRIGTAEFYRVLETMPEIADSLVVNLELAGSRSLMPLFVQLAPGGVLDEGLERRIAARLRAEGSPRHVPDRIIACPAIPYTISGKKLEVPVKRILLGARPDAVANPGVMRNPDSLAFFAALAPELLH